MKGKRNEAFFQQSKGTGSASRSSSHQSNMLMQVYKTARKTGTLNLSSKDLSRVPLDIFSLETKLESDENFWEITPLIKLDLSYNELQELPAEVGNLIDLMTLKLRNNSIQILPTSLGNCLKLRHLDLSSNSLSSIPPLSGPLPDLQECYLSENQFTQLPLFLYQAYELKVLEINSNQLRNLLPEIQNLRQLTRLCLNNNSLEELPAAIVTLRNLQVLDARKNRLSHLPNLGQLINLQLLDLGENQLTSFPSLPLNGQLGRLHLDWNHLRSIDEQEIYKISSTLFELHLHDNKIVSLPREIAHCASLKVLDVSNNDLNDIPATIGYMEALQRFLLDGNPIRAIRRTLLTQSTHDLKKYLRTRGPPLEGTEAKKETQDDEKGSSERELIRRMRDIEGDELNLSGMNLQSLPADWAPMIQRSHNFESDETAITITRMNLSRNMFVHLPIDILTTPLPNLKYIDISDNQLGDRRGIAQYVFGEVPTSYGRLPPQLRELNLSKNMLTTDSLSSLLDCFKHLALDRNYSLSRLLLANNLITSLPMSLLPHCSLRELQLSYNRLTSLENLNFSGFSHLEILDLSNNKLKALGNVYEASSLRVLLLENNEIENLPLELCHLSNLQTLSLHGNPQRTVRQAILQKGVHAILASLQSKLDPNAGPSISMTTSKSTPPATTSVTVFDRSNRITADTERRRVDSHEGMRSHAPSAAITSSSTTLSSEAPKSDSYHNQLEELSSKLHSMESRLQTDFSLSESSKYALKKDIAKVRANIMRLKRNGSA